MKTISGIALFLAVSGMASALPHGDQTFPRNLEDSDREALHSAIELISKYEYKDPKPPIKTPIKANPPHNYPRDLSEVDREALHSAIELISKYEYKDDPVTGPVYGPIKTVKPFPYPTFTTKLYHLPIATLKPVPFKPPPVYQPPIHYAKRAETGYRAEDEESLRAAIELISNYEYKGEPNPDLPIRPLKPVNVRPPPLPWKQQYKKREIDPASKIVDDGEKEKLRVAIELLSNYEYKGKPVPFPLPPIKPAPIPIRPPPQPYKPSYTKREAEADYVNEAEKADLLTAIELISKYEYKNTPDPIKPSFSIRPYPVPTLKPVKPPYYDPAPYKPVIGKREADAAASDLNKEDVQTLRAAIELISKAEYGGSDNEKLVARNLDAKDVKVDDDGEN